MIGKSNDETNFPHKLLSTNTQASKIRKSFANGSSDNIKFPKTQLSKIVQLGRFLFGSLGISIRGSPDISTLPMATIKGLSSLAESIAKETKNMSTKEISVKTFL